MDKNISPLTQMMESGIENYLGENVFVGVPGHVVSFDPDKQTATVQIGLLAHLRDGSTQTPNPILGVPVQFIGGQAGTLEFEIGPGTEGYIHFSHWCISSWVRSGGIQGRDEFRQFDSADAVFVPGVRSIAKAMTSFQNNGIRLRNASGSAYYWVKRDGNVEVDGTKLTVKCQAEFVGAVQFDSTMTNRGKDVSSTHTHTGVQSGNSVTGPVS